MFNWPVDLYFRAFTSLLATAKLEVSEFVEYRELDRFTKPHFALSLNAFFEIDEFEPGFISELVFFAKPPSISNSSVKSELHGSNVLIRPHFLMKMPIMASQAIKTLPTMIISSGRTVT